MSAVMHGETRPDGSSTRKLTFAIGASLALHGVILFVATPSKEPASRDPASEAITARLVSPPAPPAPLAPPGTTPSKPPAAPPAEIEQRARKADVTPPPSPQPKKRKPPPQPRKPAVTTSKPSQEPPKADVPSERAAPRIEEPAPADASPPLSASPLPQPADSPAPPAAPPVAAAPGGPVEAVRETGSLEAYRRELLGMAARYKRYPLVARDNNWEGMVTVRLAIGANGMIASISIAQSSGHEVLDRAAVDMIRKAKGAVPIPAALRGKPFVISIPVLYEIKDPGRG